MASRKSITQLIKKTVSATLISIVAFGSLMVIPIGRASAATLGPGGGAPAVTAPATPGVSLIPLDKFSPEKQAQIWSLIGAATYVENVGNIGKGDQGNHTACDVGRPHNGNLTADDIASGDWLWGGSKARAGNHVSPDGTVDCADAWFRDLLNNDAGFAGDLTSRGLKVFQHAGNNSNNPLFELKNNSQDSARSALRGVLADAFFGSGTGLGSARLPTFAPDHIAYQILIENFVNPSACDAQATAGLQPDAKAVLHASHDRTAHISVYNPTTQTIDTNVEYYYTEKDVSVGYGLNITNAADGILKCDTIAAQLKNAKYTAAILKYAQNHPQTPTSSTSTSGTSSDLELNCGSKLDVLTNPLNWLMCPIAEGMATVAKVLDSNINNMLTIDSQDIFVTTPGYHKAWESMRIYAIVFLIIVTLIIVISQALGFEILDAYTVRKVLPRLLIAAIAITISWQLMMFFVNLTNDLGNGIRAIIYTPFKSLEGANGVTLGAGGMLLTDLLGAGAFAALGVPGLLSFVATAALAVAVAFLVLVLRQLLIIILIIVAPVAIVCFILPNTKKIYDLWWDAFAKGLMMFPIIAAFIAVGRVGAVVASSKPGAINSFIAFVAYIAPYFLIPLTFRLAGGAIGTLGGAVNNRSRGAFDGLKNYRGNKMKQRRSNAAERARTGNTFKRAPSNSWRSKLNAGVQGVALSNQAGFDPRHMGTNIRTAVRDSSEANVAKFAQENQSFGMWSGDDAKVSAAQFDSDTDIGNELARFDGSRFAGAANTGRRNEAISQIKRTKRQVDNNTFQKARVRAQAKTGTGYQDANGQFDAALMLEDINKAYGNDANGAGRALAEMRGSLANSGQVAGVAGFGTWAQQLEGMRRGNVTAEHAHNAIMDDAINSASPGQAIYGKPSSAAAMGKAHARRIQAIASSINSGEMTMPTGQKDAAGNAILRTATVEDLSAATAGAAGIYDATSQASPANASAMANELMGVKIDGPAFPIAVQRERKNSDGSTAYGRDGKPAMETVMSESRPATIREYIQSQMNGNPEFANRRRDLSQSSLAEAQYAARNAVQPTSGNDPTRGGMPQGPVKPF